jgi:hypothetical protein
MCHADEHWTEALPLVVLGIRSVSKDLNASAVEQVYGYQRNSWPPSPAECTYITDSVSWLRVHNANFGPYQHPGLPPHPRSLSKT